MTPLSVLARVSRMAAERVVSTFSSSLTSLQGGSLVGSKARQYWHLFGGRHSKEEAGGT